MGSPAVAAELSCRCLPLCDLGNLSASLLVSAPFAFALALHPVRHPGPRISGETGHCRKSFVLNFGLWKALQWVCSVWNVRWQEVFCAYQDPLPERALLPCGSSYLTCKEIWTRCFYMCIYLCVQMCIWFKPAYRYVNTVIWEVCICHDFFLWTWDRGWAHRILLWI